eukprot:Awhi_evm1s9881
MVSIVVASSFIGFDNWNELTTYIDTGVLPKNIISVFFQKYTEGNDVDPDKYSAGTKIQSTDFSWKYNEASIADPCLADSCSSNPDVCIPSDPQTNSLFEDPVCNCYGFSKPSIRGDSCEITLGEGCTQGDAATCTQCPAKATANEGTNDCSCFDFRMFNDDSTACVTDFDQALDELNEPADCCTTWDTECYTTNKEENRFHGCYFGAQDCKPV